MTEARPDTAPTTAAEVIAAAATVHEGTLLLVRRRVPEGALSWQFPEGTVEPGERVVASWVSAPQVRRVSGLVGPGD